MFILGCTESYCRRSVVLHRLSLEASMIKLDEDIYMLDIYAQLHKFTHKLSTYSIIPEDCIKQTKTSPVLFSEHRIPLLLFLKQNFIMHWYFNVWKTFVSTQFTQLSLEYLYSSVEHGVETFKISLRETKVHKAGTASSQKAKQTNQPTNQTKTPMWGSKRHLDSLIWS